MATTNETNVARLVSINLGQNNQIIRALVHVASEHTWGYQPHRFDLPIALPGSIQASVALSRLVTIAQVDQHQSLIRGFDQAEQKIRQVQFAIFLDRGADADRIGHGIPFSPICVLKV